MSGRRTALYGSAALVGLWSLWIVSQDGSASADVEVVSPAERRTPAPSPAGAGTGTAGAASPNLSPAAGRSADPARGLAATTPDTAGRRLAEAPQRDAFATRDWAGPPPAPLAPRRAATVTEAPLPLPASAPEAVPAAAPPAAPPLPYRYIGLVDDPAGSNPRVFLAVGDKLLVARPGDLLDGGFRLERIAATELVFTHVQLGQTVRLPLAGAPS